MSDATGEISYTAAVAELERDNVDVDHLAERVQRAAVLIAHCRSRISQAQLQIERVVADLDA